MLVSLDSDMPCDVKRYTRTYMFFFFFYGGDGQSFCMQSGDVLQQAAVKYPQTIESGGQWVRSHTRTFVNVIPTLQLAKTDVNLIQIQSLTLKVAQGLFSFSHISGAASMSAQNIPPKKLREHRFIILLDLKMNILFHEHVMEPKECVHNYIIKYDLRNMVFSLRNPSTV